MKTYSDPYYIIRKLKPYLNVNAPTKTIFIPDGKEVPIQAQKYIDILVTNYGFQKQVVLDCPNYSLVLLSRSVGLRGNKIHFLQHKFFTIVPGTVVEKIGTGAATGSNHIEKFSKPHEYVGALVIDSIKYYAFQLPEEVAPDKNFDFYMLYTKDNYFAYRKVYTKNGGLDYTRTIQPRFKVVV